MKYAPHLRLIGRTSAVLEVDAGAVPLHVAHVGGVLVFLLQRISRCIFEIVGISGKLCVKPNFVPRPSHFYGFCMARINFCNTERRLARKRRWNRHHITCNRGWNS